MLPSYLASTPPPPRQLEWGLGKPYLVNRKMKREVRRGGIAERIVVGAKKNKTTAKMRGPLPLYSLYAQ